MENIEKIISEVAAKSRPAPPSSRRYHLSGRPCPQDGIIKPTASLEKK